MTGIKTGTLDTKEFHWYIIQDFWYLDVLLADTPERRMPDDAARAKGHLGRNAIFTLIFTLLAFGIAQFGLQAVVAKGYAYLGYAALITLFLPFVLHYIKTGGKEI